MTQDAGAGPTRMRDTQMGKIFGGKTYVSPQNEFSIELQYAIKTS